MSDAPLAPTHEIVIVPDGEKELREQCYDVRIQVFHHEQGFPLDTEIDEQVLHLFRSLPPDYMFPRHDETSTHFLLRLMPSRTPIGTIRAYRLEGASYYKLSRLAILKEYRRYNFGRALVLALHDWVKADAERFGGSGYAEVIAHSQIPVKAFYTK
jgi:GNAT superfamily N-acetyltransferase